jgi:hypothetical protein
MSNNIVPAAARAAAALRKLDENRQTADDDLRHSPTCQRPGTTTTVGFSVTIQRCDGPGGCGAVSTVRNIPSTPKRKKD